jgi:hypothetical protein
MSIGGIEQCDALADILRSLESSGPDMVAAGTAALHGAVSALVASGKDPNTGAEFAPTKKGTKALQHAAGALSFRIAGNIGFLVLSGHHTFHFFGTGYLPQRRANLQGRLPPRMGDAIRAGLAPVFQAKTKKGKIGTKRYDAWAAKRGVSK